MTAKSTAPYMLQVAGKELPLLRFESSKGNECYGILAKKKDGSRYLSPYGVLIPALDESGLPQQVVLAGADAKVEFPLTRGETTPKSGESHGKPKVSYRGSIAVPGLGQRNVVISFSEVSAEAWNVIAKIIPQGAGGSKVTSLADLF